MFHTKPLELKIKQFILITSVLSNAICECKFKQQSHTLSFVNDEFDPLKEI